MPKETNYRWKPLKLSPILRAELSELFARGGSLAKRAGERLNQVAYIALPPDVDAEPVTSFKNGGLCSPDPAAALLVSSIERYLSFNDAGLVAIQDFMARPGDAILQRSSLPWFDVNGEIYYVLDRNAQTPQIEAALRKAMDAYSFFGAFTQEAFSSDLSAAWAASASAGVLSVCDGETFILVSDAPQGWLAV